MYVDGWLTTTDAAVTLDPVSTQNLLRVGTGYDTRGLYGCLDEVFILSAIASRGELEFLSRFHQTLRVPSAGGAGYALAFQRGVDTEIHGGVVVVDSAGARAALGYSNAAVDSMSFAAWLRPLDQDHFDLLSSVDGARVSTYVIVDKSVSTSPGCTVPEYRLSLEGVVDRTGSSSAMTYELRVDVGAASDGTTVASVQWADSWVTGIVLPDDGQWTFLTVSWNTSTIQVCVNGSLAVRAQASFPCVTSARCSFVSCARRWCLQATRYRNPTTTLPASCLSSVTDSRFVLGGRQYPRDDAVQVSDFFAGEMESVSVWRRVLSPSHSRSLMYSAPPADALGLLAFWSFDEGTGPTVTSSVGGPAGRAITLVGSLLYDNYTPGTSCTVARVHACMLPLKATAVTMHSGMVCACPQCLV